MLIKKDILNNLSIILFIKFFLKGCFSKLAFVTIKKIKLS